MFAVLPALLLAFQAPSQATARPSDRQTALVRLDSLVRQAMAAHRIPSAAIALVHNGKVLRTAAYGPASLELPAPAGPHTLFEIGSITKQFTGIAVLQLVEQGELGLDDAIEKYLPEVPPAWHGITLHQLLTHTSGLPSQSGRPEVWVSS